MTRDPGLLTAKHVFLVLFGILPAFVLMMASFVGMGVVDGWLRLVFPASFIGTTGLIWSLAGVSRRHIRIVLTMLFIGELGMLPLVMPLIAMFRNPAESLWMRVVMLGVTLGPMVAGVVFAIDLVKKAKRPPGTHSAVRH